LGASLTLRVGEGKQAGEGPSGGEMGARLRAVTGVGSATAAAAEGLAEVFSHLPPAANQGIGLATSSTSFARAHGEDLPGAAGGDGRTASEQEEEEEQEVGAAAALAPADAAFLTAVRAGATDEPTADFELALVVVAAVAVEARRERRRSR